MMGQARRVVRELFDLLIEDPSLLPTRLQKQCNGPKTEQTARVVCDYIAGMTDSFAITEHKQLFSVSALPSQNISSYFLCLVIFRGHLSRIGVNIR